VPVVPVLPVIQTQLNSDVLQCFDYLKVIFFCNISGFLGVPFVIGFVCFWLNSVCSSIAPVE
jgi:uncharacterized membrane protein YciS (DUF1049 family)